MAEVVVFDLRRVSTVVSRVGKVHLAESGGLRTVCGVKLGGLDGLHGWRENHEDRQPQCTACRRIAYRHPTIYAFTKLLRPL